MDQKADEQEYSDQMSILRLPLHVYIACWLYARFGKSKKGPMVVSVFRSDKIVFDWLVYVLMFPGNKGPIMSTIRAVIMSHAVKVFDEMELMEGLGLTHVGFVPVADKDGKDGDKAGGG